MKPFFALSFAEFFGKSLAFINTIVIVKLLSQSDYGLLSVLQGHMSVLVPISTLALGYASTKYIPQYLASKREHIVPFIQMAIWTTMLLSFITTIFCILGSKWIAINFYSQDSLKIYIVIVSFSIFLTSIVGLFSGILQGYQFFKEVAKFNIINSVLVNLFPIIGCWLGGLIGWCFSFLIASFIVFLYMMFLLNMKIDLFSIMRQRVNWKTEISVITRFAIPSMLISFITNFSSIYLVSLLLKTENGVKENALLAVALRITSPVMLSINTISKIMLPQFSQLYASNDIIKIKDARRMNFIAILVATLLVSIPLFLFSTQILLFFGKNYLEAKSILNFFIIVTLIQSLNNFYGNIIVSRGRIKMALIYSLFFCFATLVCGQVLVNMWGVKGVVISYIVAWSLYTLLFFFDDYKLNK